MLVGDKKGMRVPSETRLGESYPLRSEQKSPSQQQRPVTNNKSTLGRADPASAERGTVPPGRQQGSRRHAKRSSRSKSLVFAAQAPVKQQAVYLGYEANAFLQGEATGSTDRRRSWSSRRWFWWHSSLGNQLGGGKRVRVV